MKTIFAQRRLMVTCLVALASVAQLPRIASAQTDTANAIKVLIHPEGTNRISREMASSLFERINLGPQVNSEYSELFPVISPDESMLFFARKGDPTNVGFAKNPLDEDIWYSFRQPDGSWTKAAHLEGGVLNTENYDGVRAMNVTGTHLYLQNLYRPDGTRGKGFSVSEKQPDGTWGYPEALEIEDYYNDTTIAMMTVSTDEQSIILSVKRKDSKGAHDLYITRCQGGRKWSKPELIEDISTPGDEISPFIAYDDRTLYFSSNGLGGYGLHDIFITHRLDDSWKHWSAPENLGSPINTPSFDAYFMVSAQGDTAYFSSAHESSTRGSGKSDLWKIGLKPQQRPGFALPNTNFADLKESQLTNALFRLDNLLFDVGRSTVKESSRPILDNVAAVLKRFPQMRIEVQGHTDADGDPDKNMKLSQLRAEAVRTYILQQGIEPSRIVAKGFGMTRPIAPNNTVRGKALNRRVMIEVLNPDVAKS